MFTAPSLSRTKVATFWSIGVVVKLSEPYNLKLANPAGFLSRALRAIGQDLTELFPEKVEIEPLDEDFVVRGHCAKSRLEAKVPKRERMSIKELLTRAITLRPQETKSASVPFTRAYAPEDIARLDEAGISRRSGVKKTPDIRNLGETLRTVGRLIEAEQGRLIRISKDVHRVSFEYVNGEGATCKQDISSMDLYKLQKRYYENRDETLDETKPASPFRLQK